MDGWIFAAHSDWSEPLIWRPNFVFSWKWKTKIRSTCSSSKPEDVLLKDCFLCTSLPPLSMSLSVFIMPHFSSYICYQPVERVMPQASSRTVVVALYSHSLTHVNLFVLSAVVGWADLQFLSFYTAIIDGFRWSFCYSSNNPAFLNSFCYENVLE